MAITYKELKRLIRFKTKDNNKIRFSDYDVKEAVNEALRYFSNSYALQNSDFLEKRILFDEYALNEAIDQENASRIDFDDIVEAVENGDTEPPIDDGDQEVMPDDKEEDDVPETNLLPRYNFAETGVEIPDDFISLQGVIRASDGAPMHPVEGIKKPMHDQYKVMGNRFYFGSPYVYVLYKAAFAEVKDENSVIEVPFIFKDSLAKIACMILENNATTDVLMEAVNDAARNLVPRRRYVNGRIKMPFMV